ACGDMALDLNVSGCANFLHQLAIAGNVAAVTGLGGIVLAASAHGRVAGIKTVHVHGAANVDFAFGEHGLGQGAVAASLDADPATDVALARAAVGGCGEEEGPTVILHQQGHPAETASFDDGQNRIGYGNCNYIIAVAHGTFHAI